MLSFDITTDSLIKSILQCTPNDQPLITIATLLLRISYMSPRHSFIIVKIIILSIYFVISCKNPPDTSNVPVTTDIPTVVQLSADPLPPLVHYDANVKPKLIATVVPSKQGEVTGGVVAFTLDEKEICGAGVPLDANWQAICVPDKIGGGEHTITAHYSGSKGYTASINTAQMTYAIDQVPIKDDHFLTKVDQQSYFFDSSVEITATITKDAETDPDFDLGHLEFSITNIMPRLLGLYHTTDTRDITKKCSFSSNKNGLQTTFTCKYQIMPDDFIEDAGAPEGKNYTVTFDAKYNADDNYQTSSIRSSNKTEIQKLSFSIKTTERQCDGHTDNIYMNGQTVCFTASTQGNPKNIPFQKSVELYLNDKTGKNVGHQPNNCTSPTGSSWICQYEINKSDITDDTRYFSAQYPGDRAYKISGFDEKNSQIVNKITDGHMLGQFTLDSLTSSTVQMGDIITLSGTIKPEQNGENIDANNLKVHFSNGAKNQSSNLQNCSAPPTGGQYSQCKYQIIGADLENQYNAIQTEYKGNTYKIQYTIPVQNIQISKRTLDGQLSFTNQNEYYVGQRINFQFVLNSALPENIPTPKIGIQHNDGDAAQAKQIQCEFGSSDRNTFTCAYQIQASDADSQKTQDFKLCFVDNGSCQTTDPHYQWKDNAPLSVQLKNVKLNEPNGALSYQMTKTGYPVNVELKMGMTRKNEQPYLGKIEFYHNNDPSPIGNCTPNLTDNACTITYTYQIADYANNTTFSAKYKPTETIPDSYKPSETALDSKTIAQQSCTLSINNAQAVDYLRDEHCTVNNGCNFNPAFTCYSEPTNTILTDSTLKIAELAMTNAGGSIVLPDSPKHSPAITLNFTPSQFSFIPISDKIRVDGKIMLGNNQIATLQASLTFFADPGNKSDNDHIAACGGYGNTTQRMFDCYARNTRYGGIGTNHSNYNLPDPTKNDPKVWYLVSCADTDLNHCVWLSPEIPSNVPNLDHYYSSRTPQFSTQMTDGRPIGYNPSNPDDPNNPQNRKKLAAGQRLLWSGELPLSLKAINTSKDEYEKNFVSFTDVNGLGQIPRCGLRSPTPQSPRTDAPNPSWRSNANCKDGDWNYYTNLGGYDAYECAANCKYNTLDPVAAGSDKIQPRSQGMSLRSLYSLSALPSCLQNGGVDGDANCSVTMFYSVDNSWLNTRGRLLGAKNGNPPDNRDFEPAKVTDAYKDICTRINNDFVDLSKIPNRTKQSMLIYDNISLKTNWHVPSYPEILILTGAGPGCVEGGWFSSQIFFPYCPKTALYSGDIVGFRAGNTWVPGFSDTHSFFSSSAVKTSEQNGDLARVWIFQGGDVIPGYPATEIEYLALGSPPSATKLMRVQRCVSTEW